MRDTKGVVSTPARARRRLRRWFFFPSRSFPSRSPERGDAHSSHDVLSLERVEADGADVHGHEVLVVQPDLLVELERASREFSILLRGARDGRAEEREALPAVVPHDEARRGHGDQEPVHRRVSRGGEELLGRGPGHGRGDFRGEAKRQPGGGEHEHGEAEALVQHHVVGLVRALRALRRLDETERADRARGDEPV